MTARRWGDLAAVVVAIVVAAGLVFVLRPQHTATVAVEPAAAHIDRPGQGTTKRPTMLFIGDSYVAGTGLDETSYGCMAAQRMGWYCRVAAGPGTGYISGGPANRFELEYIGESTAFNERIPKLARAIQPDVVILDGGRNDQFPPPDAVYDAMVSTISDVRRTWPAATVVVLRPRFLSRPGNDLGFNDEFFDRLRAEEVTEHQVMIADPIGGLVGTDTAGMVVGDEIHPNRRGELAMSSALYDTLIRLGFTPAS